jgi:REP element-mobilizing transposase RayT
MARPLRADVEGAIHHVMIRGVEGRAIFSGDSDAEDFLTRFGLLVRELGSVVLAWCLLTNHGHFVIRTGAAPLSRLMARLGSRHAQRFNRANERVGHLFQDRYKAVPIEDDGALARCIAYVVANPVRHGLMTMRELAGFPHSGYGALVGRRLARPFECPGEVARALGVGRDRLAEVVYGHAVDPSARSAALEPDQLEQLDLLIRNLCRQHGVSESALRRALPEARAARDDVCSLAATTLALSVAEVSRHIPIPYGTAKRLYADARARA